MRALILFFVLATPIFSYAEEKAKVAEPVYVEENGLKILVKDEDQVVCIFSNSIKEITDEQLKSNTNAVTTPEPITTRQAGIPHIKKLLKDDQKIEGYARLNGWFIYATGLFGKVDDKPQMYHIGYAIKAGGTKIILWGGW